MECLCFINNVAGGLKLPQHSTHDSPTPDVGVILSHARFLAVLLYGKTTPPKDCVPRAAEEVRIVHALFPSEYPPHTLLALTAWFSYACHFDDVIEDMQAQPAQRALDTIRKSFRSGTWTGEPCPAIQASYNLYNRLSSLISSSVTCDRTFQAIDRVLDGFEREPGFLERQKWNTEEYIQIRANTISVGPCFAIMSAAVEEVSPGLKLLEHIVSLVTGLQNDIFGLVKDIRQDKVMNYIVVHHMATTPTMCLSSAFDQGKLLPGMREAVDRHNTEARRAELQLDVIIRTATAAEQAYASEVYDLMCSHLKWVKESSRYRADMEG